VNKAFYGGHFMDCHIVRTWKNVIGCCFSLMLKRGYTVYKHIMVLRYNIRSVLYIYMYFVLLEITSAVSCSTVHNGE